MGETLYILSLVGLAKATTQLDFRWASAKESDLSDIRPVGFEITRIALERSTVNGHTTWEGRVIAALHILRTIETAMTKTPHDLIVLEWDAACGALIAACDSPRLIDLHCKFLDQSRRVRIAKMQEGKLDRTKRQKHQKSFLNSVVVKNTSTAIGLFREDIVSELKANG